MASSQTPAAPSAIETLKLIDFSLPHQFAAPSKRIHESQDVARFLISPAYRDIGIFILQLNHALCPRIRPGSPRPAVSLLSKNPSVTPSILSLQGLLSRIGELIDEAPPDPGPRRFGNVSFRKWYDLLGERIDALLQSSTLEGRLSLGGGGARIEVKRYLLGSFGNAQRLDYGTGHELSFMAFLGCLWKLGYFEDGAQGGDIEREIVLSVIEPYLELTRKLIATYTLEPAGSHGVWGLDDHSFVPYIFGSAQLTRPIAEGEPMPMEGSVKGAPKPSDVTKADAVEDHRRNNMYFSAIGFIYDVKKGPFWEHSPMLFDISGIRDGWGKINKGMIKMYQAEVLSKFPVVQHFPFGSLFSWDENAQTSAPTRSTVSIDGVSQTIAADAGIITQAPWATTSRAPSLANAQIPSRGPPRATSDDPVRGNNSK